MIRERAAILAALAAGLMSGCSLRGATAIPTPYPLDYIPTAVALTGQAALSSGGSASATPSATEVTQPTPTAIPAPVQATATAMPEPGFDAFAEIRFLSPGPMSKLASPFRLQTILVSGESGLVRIELIGEDGRELYRLVERLNRNSAGLYRNWEIPFEIRAAAEAAWLQISSKDEVGRTQALNSVRVLLLSLGTSELNPPGNVLYERVTLLTPGVEVVEADGVVDVKGRIWPMNDEPVILDLILPDGKTAGTRVLEFNGIEPQSFESTLPYKVTAPEGSTESIVARLTVKQSDPILKIPLYIYTRTVQLRP